MSLDYFVTHVPGRPMDGPSTKYQVLAFVRRPRSREDVAKRVVTLVACVLEHAARLTLHVERSRPRTRPRLRIVDGHFIAHRIFVDAPVAFREVQRVARAAIRQPAREIRDVDNQRVAVPVPA